MKKYFDNEFITVNIINNHTQSSTRSFEIYLYDCNIAVTIKEYTKRKLFRQFEDKMLPKELSDIMNFLVRDNKFTLIKNYDDNFRNLIKDKYLNNNFIIYFGRLAINEIESVAKIFNNINFFKAEDLSKMADATFLFDRNYDRVFDKIEDPNNVGELWFNYGE